ncbi:MAG: VWA domain-containing protein [Bacteroidales bacterium]|nr:VWA domain-containing protein [Bacteroidales bacterium]
MFHNITFANPWVLLGLILVPLLIAWYIWRYRKQDPTIRISDLSLINDVKPTLRQRLRPLLYVLRVLAITALIIALARPQRQMSREEMQVEGIDVVLAMDISGSMMAEDFRPNRLEAAKKVAASFIEGRKDDRIGLVVFAGEAFTQIPLTIDHHVLLDQLSHIKTGIIKDGTAMGDGLATAVNRLKESKAKSKVIILLTDGINNQGSVDPQNAAEIAALYDIRLYTIGVGTRGMAPYPFKDQFGRTVYQNVPVEIDENLLTSMAQSTKDGKYFRSTNKQSLENIFSEIDRMEKTKVDVTRYENYKDIYLPLLLFALACLGLELLLQLLYFK